MAQIASQIQAIHRPYPRTIPRPPEDTFYVTQEDWEQTLFAIIHGTPLLVLGPAGCGKTELLLRAAQAVRRTPASFNMGAMTDPRSSLIGVTHFNGSTCFQESRFIKALRKSYTTLILDEINRAPKEALNILIPLLDDQRYIALDEAEDCAIVHPAEGVGFVATANIGSEYTGTNDLDWAMMDRFQSVIRMNFLDPAREEKILLTRTGVPLRIARCLAGLAQKQRDQWCSGEYATPISTRSLIAAAKACASGIPIDFAVTYCITNHFSATGGLVSDSAKLSELWKFVGIRWGLQ